jgi:2-succinyl-5-enolpyruvyl-6-hydroxy-3-cyclohexene-1-carboxylate synthase
MSGGNVGNLHIAWARLLFGALSAAGVTDVVLSPGSRSTPLAIAAATDPALRLHVIVDERSAAFFALGQARVTGRPSVLVCTSGTAGAHYLPAVIEACQAFVPMIVVTADRPSELYDAAAPQTIDQVGMFGGFVRHHAELGLPDAAPSALRAVPRIAAQAVARALGPTPGPVHVNARFRKPLEPVDARGPEPWEPLVSALAARGPTVVRPPLPSPDAAAVAEIAERMAHAERGLIVCGPAPLAQAAGRDAILALARRTGFPLLAEATSQIRFGGDRAGVTSIAAFDAILRVPALRARFAPDFVLELGAPPTSTGYAALVADLRAAPRHVIAPHGWNDPQGDASALVLADPTLVARLVADRLPERTAPSPWAAAFSHEDARAATIAASALAGLGLTGGAVARTLVRSCPDDAILAVGNSTPVRDLDAFCPPSPRALGVLSQRGASGIDGLLSGAAGARSVSRGPVALLLGDLSLLHDLGGLAQMARAPAPFVAVVVQNGGGRIFEALPVAARVDRDLFERCFVTPEPVRFEHAAAAFGVAHARVETEASLDEALRAAWTGGRATLIEAMVAPREDARLRKQIQEELGT